MTRTITKAIYLLFAAISIVFGATSLLAASVFIGLLALWCNFNYDRSKTVHYFLTFFNLLVAAIHWYDYSLGDLPLTSPLFNSLGFVVFTAIAIIRWHK